MSPSALRAAGGTFSAPVELPSRSPRTNTTLKPWTSGLVFLIDPLFVVCADAIEAQTLNAHARLVELAMDFPIISTSGPPGPAEAGPHECARLRHSTPVSWFESRIEDPNHARAARRGELELSS